MSATNPASDPTIRSSDVLVFNDPVFELAETPSIYIIDVVPS